MSWLMRRHWPLAWAGWRDLDADHARPNENPIRRPWARVNSNRTVWLEDNVLKINDYSETLFELGGVSYEKQPFTENWGVDFDANFDANVIQQNFFGAALTPSWSNVGFGSLIERPIIAIWREALSASENVRVIVYHDLATIQTLTGTQTYSGFLNRTWWKFRLLVDRDRLVRVYWNGILVLQYWLPNQYKSGPGNRSLSFLNQTSAWSEMKNFRVFDHDTIFKTTTQWNTEVKSDDFNRPNGAVANGWIEFGTAGQVVNNTYSTTGTTAGSSAIMVDTGSTNSAQRIEATIGGNIAPNTTADSSLILRCNAEGTEGIMANVYSSAIFIAKFTGSLTNPTMSDYTSTPITIASGDKIAFSVVGNGVWVEKNGVVSLLADLNGAVSSVAHTYCGLRVERQGSVNSPSWNDVRILTAA